MHNLTNICGLDKFTICNSSQVFKKYMLKEAFMVINKNDLLDKMFIKPIFC